MTVIMLKYYAACSNRANKCTADLAGDFVVWLASQEAKFLRGKFVWVNWDVDEMIANALEIECTTVLTLGLDGFSSFKY